MDSMIVGMAQCARKAHEGQFRKFTKKPYITHPVRVAGQIILLEEATPVLVAAGYGHDLYEDTDITKSDIAQTFGSELAELIDELTNKFTKDTHPKLNREKRKALELDRLSSISRFAKIIKMIDRHDNLSEIDFRDDFTSVYLQESFQLWEKLANAHQTVADTLHKTIFNIRWQIHSSLCPDCETSPMTAVCRLGEEILAYSPKAFSIIE